MKFDARVHLYFNTSFDILKNTDEALDVNKNVPLDDINALLFEWGATRDGAARQYSQHSNFTCIPAAPSAAPAPAAEDPPCAFSRYVPGFWDRSSHSFLPTGCAYRPETWPQRPAAGRRWIHLLGDSNMRKLHTVVCRRLGGNRTFHGQNPDARPGTALIWSACFTADMTTAIVHSVSWMHKGRSVDVKMKPVFVGQTLSGALCSYADKQDGAKRALPAAVCDKEWDVAAERTVVLVGSHQHQQLIPTALDDVRSWLNHIAGRVPRPETLSAALVTAVCVNQFALWRKHFGQLFQRNNYRVRAVNDVTAVALAERGGLPWMDTFSVSLAAGCKEESADVVHFRDSIYIAIMGILFSHLAHLEAS